MAPFLHDISGQRGGGSTLPVTLFAGGGGWAGAVLAACTWIKAPGVGFLYIAGVSAYSTALVFYPARSGRPGLAALVYAVAGWGGSALGIGLAQGRTELPAWLIIVAGAAVLLGLMWRNTLRRRET